MSALLIWANAIRPFYTIDDDYHLQVATEDPIASYFELDRDQTLMPVTFLSMRLDRLLFGPPFSEKLFKKVGRIGRPIDEIIDFMR